jgi:hypothetical protein
MSTRIGPAPTEQWLLVASAEDTLGRQCEQPSLAASSERPNRDRRGAAERRNEHRLLARRLEASER